MDEGKVLICNLRRVDGETRRPLGSLIVTGLRQAASSRTDMAPSARWPFYLLMDEFQDYVAQKGSEQTLSQILSECRRFGLNLAMAHQHRGQLGNTLQGALENAQVGVISSVGWQTARALVEEVYRPETGVPSQGERESLAEQWERFTQQAQRLGHHEILVQLPDREGVRRLWTCTVPPMNLAVAQSEAIRKRLARQSGQSVAAMRRALAGREKRTQVEEYETIGGLRMIKLKRIAEPSYRPLLLTTRAPYSRWRELLWNVRVPERRSVIVMLPPKPEKARASLLAIAKSYRARGGAVRVIEADRGVERYHEVRQRLAGGWS